MRANLSRQLTISKKGFILNTEKGATGKTVSPQLNDPTQFEQVDETCEFGGAVLYSESLDMTAFLGIDAPRKI